MRGVQKQEREDRYGYMMMNTPQMLGYRERREEQGGARLEVVGHITYGCRLLW